MKPSARALTKARKVNLVDGSIEAIVSAAYAVDLDPRRIEISEGDYIVVVIGGREVEVRADVVGGGQPTIEVVSATGVDIEPLGGGLYMVQP